MDEILPRTVGVLLKQEPGVALCDACLAFACSSSLLELRQVTECLVRDDARFQRASTCASCRRAVLTTCFGGPAKCAHCGQPLSPDDPGVVVENERFHAHCARRLVTDETVRVSRALGRRSRALIAESLRRLGEDPTPSP